MNSAIGEAVRQDIDRLIGVLAMQPQTPEVQDAMVLMESAKNALRAKPGAFGLVGKGDEG